MTAMAPLPDYEFLRRLAALPFVDALWLYGSRARGSHGARADIDLAVLCPRASTADWQTVLDVIEDADTLLAIDCVRFDALSAGDPLRGAIEREHKILHEKAAV